MTRVLWLPDYAADEGLRVVTIPGWQKRGLDGLRPRCIVCHHIGIPGAGNAPGLGVVTHGRADLRGALCNGHLARNGTVSIVASGVAYHAGKGGFRGAKGNSSALGIEAEGTIGERMPTAERDAYERLVAAWLRGLELEENSVCAHHHWRAEKPDAWALIHPAGEWDRFVAAVGRRLADDVEEWLMALSDKEQAEVLALTRANNAMLTQQQEWFTDGAPELGIPSVLSAVTAMHYELNGVPGGKPALRQKMTDLRDSLARLIRGQQTPAA